MCLGILSLVRVLLPDVEPEPPRRFDAAGLALLGLGTVGLLYGLSQAAGSLTAPGTWAPFVVGIAAFGAFAVVEQRSDHAAFPIWLFSRRIFLAAVVSGIGWNFAQATTGLQLANLCQYVASMSPFAVAAGQLPLFIGMVLMSVVAGRALTRGAPASRIVGIGFLLLTLGTASFFAIGDGVSYLAFLPGLLLLGVGLAYASVAQSQLYLVEAPDEEFGPVTASRMTVGQFGYALGLAGSAVVMSQLLADGVVESLRDSVPAAHRGASIAAVRLQVRAASTGDAGEGVIDAGDLNYLDAFSDTMLVSAGLIALLGLTTWLLLRGRCAEPDATV